MDIHQSTKSPQGKNLSQEKKQNIEIAQSYLEKAQKWYKKYAGQSAISLNLMLEIWSC